jgi:hypothetical protein
VLTSVQAIPDASSRNLRFGNNCGGRANGAKSWEVHQDGLVSNPNTTKPVPFLQSLNSYAVTADEELILFPSATDSVGNWLNDLNNASFVQESHSSGLTLANFIQTQHDQTATACPTGHTKIVFKADTATEKLSAPKITLRGDHGTGSSSISSFINLVIKPGVPKDLRVRFGTDAENEADVVEAPTTVTAGQCFRPMVSVRDANGNLVHNFTGGVNMNLFLMDYYNDANVSPKKQLVQPGGIYKRTGSGTQAMYVPITSLESHVQATSFTPSGSSTTYTAASHTSSSAMDPEPITYYASESSARIVSDGILKVSDRYVCLMDPAATTLGSGTNKGPKLVVAIRQGDVETSPTYFGSTEGFQSMTVNAGAAAGIDFRNQNGDRLCRLWYSMTGFPVMVNINGQRYFDKISNDNENNLVCRNFRVGPTNTPSVRPYWIDKIGNIKDSTMQGSWTSIAVPTSTTYSAASSEFQITSLTKKGTVGVTWVFRVIRTRICLLWSNPEMPPGFPGISKVHWALTRQTRMTNLA